MTVNSSMGKGAALVLGISIFLGLSTLGFLLGRAAIEVKNFERSVTVKGLSEREYPADIVIWPIQYTVSASDLEEIYRLVDGSAAKIRQYLITNGIKADEITVSSPSVTDKLAQDYGNNNQPRYRYNAYQTLTVYTRNIPAARNAMGSLSELGKKGIIFTGGNYDYETEYLFTRLNEVKPAMIEEATRKAREVAEKFAADSQSTLGKIKRATQGRFSIDSRDKNNPHIKKVRVVSTVEYYLSD